MDLPIELLIQIIGYVNAKDSLSLALTAHKFYDYLHNDICLMHRRNIMIHSINLLNQMMSMAEFMADIIVGPMNQRLGKLMSKIIRSGYHHDNNEDTIKYLIDRVISLSNLFGSICIDRPFVKIKYQSGYVRKRYNGHLLLMANKDATSTLTLGSSNKKYFTYNELILSIAKLIICMDDNDDLVINFVDFDEDGDVIIEVKY